MSGDNWLDDQANEDVRAQAEQKSIDFSRLYLLFETHPVAKLLLAQWDGACLRKRTPVNAPITQYAADEAVRDFVAGIHKQIAIAQKVPTTST